MTPLIAVHAIGAFLALLLGAVNLSARPKGGPSHRVIGRVWVVSMYWTVLSSFFIRELNPGGFSWIHGLSMFTLVTLTIGLWAAVTRRIETHRHFMRGSYFGTVGAFIGATVVPQRDIPQLVVHHPMLLSVAALGVVTLAWGIVASARRGKHAPALTRERSSVRSSPFGDVRP